MSEVRIVDLKRSSRGYGFTIFGERPCQLRNVVTSGVAASAGVKPGDEVIQVNGVEVADASHDHVVSLIGSTLDGYLRLVLRPAARRKKKKNLESSNREGRHPKLAVAVEPHSNGSRPRALRAIHNQYNRSGGGAAAECKRRHQDKTATFPRLSLGRRGGGKENIYADALRADYSDGDDSDGNFENNDGTLGVVRQGSVRSCSNEPLLHYLAAASADSDDGGDENMMVGVTLPSRKGSTGGSSTCSSTSSSLQWARYHLERSRSLEHGRNRAGGKSKGGASVFKEVRGVLGGVGADDGVYSQVFQGISTSSPVSHGVISPLQPTVCLARAVVGYIGSIEMPSELASSRGGGGAPPGTRLHALRSCVRRLRTERKVNTLVLMEVLRGHVALTNLRRITVARYPAERIAFVGVCPDDKRFFGIVTSHPQHVPGPRPPRSTGCGMGSSCHVFMVRPERRLHNLHVTEAQTLGVSCTPDNSGEGTCIEFPRSATPILQAMAILYRPQSEEQSNVTTASPSTPHISPSTCSLSPSNSESKHNVSPASTSTTDSGIAVSNLPHFKVPSLPTFRSHPHHVAATTPSTSHISLTSTTTPPPATMDDLELQYSAHNLRRSMRKYLAERQNMQDRHHYRRSLPPSGTSGCNDGNDELVETPAWKVPITHHKVAMIKSDVESGNHTFTSSDISGSVEHESYNDGSSSRPPWSRGRSFHRETQRSRRHARSTSRESTAATAALSDTEPDDYGCNARLSAGRLHATASLDSVASVSVSSPSAGLLSPSSAAGNTTRLVSNHNNNNDVYLHQQRRKSSSSPSAPGRVTSWALSLDKLLTDPVGLHVFTEFLTKEFSKENIIFWTACESFRRLTSENEMRQEAAGIFQRHLCPTGENPVNVDSKVRQDTERLLTQPHQTMFDAAQRQIYQLMRYDSYTRFIRSDSYQELVKKEMSGKIITLITDTNEKVIQDVSSGRSGGGSRHHLGDSGTEEPRRRSLLPWIGRSKKLNTLLGHVFPNAPYSTTHGFTSYNPTQHLQHATKALDS